MTLSLYTTPPVATVNPGPPGAPGLVGRGLTYSLQASKGVESATAGGKCIYWRNQAGDAPARFHIAGGGVVQATAINSNPTLTWAEGTESGATSDANTGASGFGQSARFYSSQEFSIAACLRYTGSINEASNVICPAIASEGTGGGNPPVSCGLSVGLDSGDATKVKFLGWASPDSGSSVKIVTSASYLKANAHFVVLTFSAATGNLSLYVDDDAAVVTGSVGLITALEDGTSVFLSIGTGPVSTNQQLGADVLEVDGWCVCLTAAEVATVQAWLKLVSGLT